MGVLFGILNMTISNKRLLVKFIVVAGQLEVISYFPQNLVEWSKQSDETANVEHYGTVNSYVTHQQLCIVFVLCFVFLFYFSISTIALVVNKDILYSLTRQLRLLSTVYGVDQFYCCQAATMRRAVGAVLWVPDGELGENDVGFPTVGHCE